MKKIFFLTIVTLCGISVFASDDQRLVLLENYFSNLFARTRFGKYKIKADFAVIQRHIEEEELDPNVQFKYGDTILNYLCELNDSESIQKFIEAYRPNIADNPNDLLGNAIKYNTSIEFIRMLLDYGVPVDGKGKDGAIVMASIYNHEDIVALLLECGAVQQQGSALLSACSNQMSGVIIELLISYGADVNYSDRGYSSCLTRAVESNQIGIVKLLLDHGAEVNFINRYGFSPLMIAVKKGDIEKVKLLLEYDADMHITNNEEASLFTLAEELGKDEIIQLLKAHGEKRYI